MTLEQLADKSELQELANKLFMYCDAQQWLRLMDEVLLEEIWFDMSSAGGAEPAMVPSRDICAMWKEGFRDLDAVHHQAGHYIITVKNSEADIFGYAVATHFKKSAKNGQTRSFVGSYELKARTTSSGWRLSQFKYNLKYIDGNSSLE